MNKATFIHAHPTLALILVEYLALYKKVGISYGNTQAGKSKQIRSFNSRPTVLDLRERSVVNNYYSLESYIIDSIFNLWLY